MLRQVYSPANKEGKYFVKDPTAIFALFCFDFVQKLV